MIYGFDDNKHKIEVMSYSNDVIVLRKSVTLSANEEKTFEFTDEDVDIYSLFLSNNMLIPQFMTGSQSGKQFYPISLVGATISIATSKANITVKNESNSPITGFLHFIFMRFS